jgi:hypothetical protein
VKKHSIEKRFVGLIIGGISLFVGVVGIGIGSAALLIANQNEKKIDVIQQQLKSLEEKAINIKKFLEDQYTYNIEVKDAIKTIEKKVDLSSEIIYVLFEYSSIIHIGA